MNTALLIAGLALAAVLAVAGIAKLADLTGSRRAVAAFGVPPRLAGPLGTALPAAELSAAALLAAGALSSLPAWIGGLAALVLLTAFSMGIAVNLLRGRTPDCHCFGQLHSAPAGPSTLARNGGLLALAAFVASGGEPVLTAAAAGASLALLVVAVNRTPREQNSGVEGLPTGTLAPAFRLPDLAGRVHTLDSLLASGQPVLLLFSDPGCGPCTALAPEVARWQRELAGELTVAVVENEADDRDPAAPDEYGRLTVLVQRASEVAGLYRALGTPTAVLIGRDGAIAGPVAAGSVQIEAVVADAVGGLAPSTIRVHRAPVAPLRRRELLVRGAGVWAAASALLALPLRATAGIRTKLHRRAEPCEDVFDCPDQRSMRCRNGRCVCEEGSTRCDPDEATDRKCFDLQRSKDHCGSCNHPCTGADHDVCCEGVCGEFGRTRCNCSTADATAECGDDEVCTCGLGVGDPCECFSCSELGERRCGNRCANPNEFRCCGDRLYRIATLPPGEWVCCGPARNRRFVNIAESERNCGRCDRRCPPDEFCYGGSCRKSCPQGLKKCGNTCIHPRGSDPRNCGGCGVKCTGPFDTGECCNGSCCDINGDTCCPGGCTNTALNNDNCGGCGIKCKPNEFCRFGVCTCPPGETC